MLSTALEESDQYELFFRRNLSYSVARVSYTDPMIWASSCLHFVALRSRGWELMLLLDDMVPSCPLHAGFCRSACLDVCLKWFLQALSRAPGGGWFLKVVGRAAQTALPVAWSGLFVC